MAVSYDPDKAPLAGAAVFDQARELGMQVVNVICAERGSHAEEPSVVSFIATVPFLPRSGDRIELPDGTIVEVFRSYFRAVGDSQRTAGETSWHLVPNVVAYPVET